MDVPLLKQFVLWSGDKRIPPNRKDFVGFQGKYFLLTARPWAERGS